MSTKCSLAYGENFHLYHECFDNDNVYLRLINSAFQVDRDNVTVTIPIYIWETIRHFGEPDLSKANLSDAEIFDLVTSKVDERIKEFQEANGNKQKQAVLNFFGSLVYGGAEEPKETQIELGVEYYKKERSRQQEIQRKIEELRKENDRKDYD